MLSSSPFYNRTTEKAIIAFGNLFKNVYIERRKQDGTVEKTVQVPVSYAPKEKFLAREQQQPNIDNSTEELTLPRLAFEITGFQPDASRRMNPMQQRKAVVGGQTNSVFNPAPWNLEVSLYAIAKYQTDALMMFEQIVATFNPSYIVTMKAMPELNLTDDVTIVLDTVQHEDNYDQKFEQRRTVVFTFNFTIQLNYYGGVDKNRAVIKQTEVDMVSGTTDPSQLRPSIELIKNTVNPQSANAGDDHTVITEIDGFK
jgi:hypothetical protein